MIDMSLYRIDIVLKRIGYKDEPTGIISQVSFGAHRSLKKARKEYDTAKGAIEDLHYHLTEVEEEERQESHSSQADGNGRRG